MPELPEVESIRIQLERFLLGHTIENIEIRNAKYLLAGRQGEIRETQHVIGQKIISVRRFGKILVIDLSSGYSIVTHVKMTGQFIYRNTRYAIRNKLSPKVVGGVPGLPAEAYLNPEKLKGGVAKAGKHTHVIFHLDRGGILYFNDYRRFGWMKLIKMTNDKSQMTNKKDNKGIIDNYIGKLGHEFLKDLTVEEFSEIVSKSKKPIKVLLMDQQKMAGVGNIYANDALWLAKVKPEQTANSLLTTEKQKLFEAIESVLKEGIKRGGASELAFVTPDGGEGKYQDFTLVYGREGKPCKDPACRQAGVKIKKLKLGGRGTYFCPACQS